jgi:DNA-binding GntR family transcriptional regulator
MTVAPEPNVRANPIDRPASLKDAAYRAIKDQLVSGGLEHDKIYSAQHFAGLLGVSRTPVREALLQLAGEGFLVCLEARGFKIKDFSAREIADVFETRRMIESFVARRLVESLGPADFRTLKENLRAMAEQARQGNVHGFMEADKEFHLSLVRRAGNQMLVSIMETIRNHIAVFGLKALSHQGRFQEVIREHRAIVKALEQKDRRRALRAVHHHLVATETCLLGNEPDPGPTVND